MAGGRRRHQLSVGGVQRGQRGPVHGGVQLLRISSQLQGPGAGAVCQLCHLQAAARVRGAQLAVHQPEARVPPGVAGVGGHGGPVRGPDLRGVLVPEGAGGVEEVGRHDGGAVGDLALVVCTQYRSHLCSQTPAAHPV